MTAAPGGDVWIYSERREVALELLTVGRSLAGQRGARLAGVTVGPGAPDRAGELLDHGADRCLAFETATAGGPTPDEALAAVASVVATEAVAILLIGATAFGTEVAARLAQRLRLGCATDCLSLDASDGSLEIERRCLGRFIARQRILTTPAVATVPPRRFEPPARQAARNGRAREDRAVEVPSPRVRIVATARRATSQVAVGAAAALVAVGRGLKRREDLGLVEDLANSLAGVVVATRPLTDDLAWLPVDVKVGLSGQTVRPELYVACGVSGQIEHVVGMRESRLVVAINTDPAAPIFQEADLSVVADLYQAVPALARAIRRQRAGSEGPAAGDDGPPTARQGTTQVPLRPTE